MGDVLIRLKARARELRAGLVELGESEQYRGEQARRRARLAAKLARVEHRIFILTQMPLPLRQ
jgi:hypothetical protein